MAEVNILGISAFYHDSAASLLVDGKLVAAAHEERFTRKKHDKRFPKNAVAYCLSVLPPDKNIDYIAFYDNFALKRGRTIANAFQYYPHSLGVLRDGVKRWDKYKIFMENAREILNCTLSQAEKRTYCINHHVSHAASAFYCSELDESAILTIDGVGEYATTTIGKAEDGKVKLLKSINFPHSLGLLYSAFTYYLGFKVNSGEYKVMGLAPLGDPIYKEKIFSHLLSVNDDASFELNLDYFTFHISDRMMNVEKMEQLVGFPKRNSEGKLEQHHKDLASSLQAVIDVIINKLAEHAKREAGSNNLCVAGGVGLNCSSFGKLLNQKKFEKIYIQPAAGDAGGSLGAALMLHAEKIGRKKFTPSFSVYMGPDINSTEAKEYFVKKGYPFREVDEQELTKYIAEKIAAGKYIGWSKGRMEWGPRALGNRSILGSPLKPGIQKDLNLLVKKREDFRPFAPVVLEEAMADLFINGSASPYMTFVYFLKKNFRAEESSIHMNGITLGPQQFKAVKEAVIHKDWSARVQTINEKQNPAYYSILKKYFEITGCPMLVNTSFNVRGEPIVCTHKEAYRCFMRANLDILVVGNLVLLREDQPQLAAEELEVFELD
jgi:carbamoyltransferase